MNILFHDFVHQYEVSVPVVFCLTDFFQGFATNCHVVIWSSLCRRIPYVVALRHKHRACAALLDPASAEPLVWPSPLKFISELDREAKALLEQALLEANKVREKNIFRDTGYSLPSPSHSEAGTDDNTSEVIYFKGKKSIAIYHL